MPAVRGLWSVDPSSQSMRSVGLLLLRLAVTTNAVAHAMFELPPIQLGRPLVTDLYLDTPFFDLRFDLPQIS